jgi:hypothetical protein
MCLPGDVCKPVARARLIYLSARAAVIAGTKTLNQGDLVIADRGFSLIDSAVGRVLFNPLPCMERRVKENPPYTELPFVIVTKGRRSYGEQPGYDDPVCLIALPFLANRCSLRIKGGTDRNAP